MKMDGSFQRKLDGKKLKAQEKIEPNNKKYISN